MKTYKVTWYTKQHNKAEEHECIVTGKNAADARKNFEDMYYDSGMPPLKKPHPFGLTIRLESSKTSGKSDETETKE